MSQFKTTLFLFALLAQAGCASLLFANTESVSVCDVISNPKSLDGKRVRLSAEVDSDFMHFVLLKDHRCPNKGLPLGSTTQLGSKTSTEFDGVMEKKRREGGTVSAAFVGVIHYTSGDFPHAEINIIMVSDVRYVR